MLLFQLGFFAGAYLFIRFADSVERARLDQKGFHYREIPRGSNVSKIAMDAGPLAFVPYREIKNIYYKDGFFSGRQLFMTLESGTIPLVPLGVLSKQEKQEIIDVITSKIKI